MPSHQAGIITPDVPRAMRIARSLTAGDEPAPPMKTIDQGLDTYR